MRIRAITDAALEALAFVVALFMRPWRREILEAASAPAPHAVWISPDRRKARRVVRYLAMADIAAWTETRTAVLVQPHDAEAARSVIKFALSELEGGAR